MVELLDSPSGRIDAHDRLVERIARAMERPVEIAMSHGRKELETVVLKVLAERLELANRLEEEKLARKRRYADFSTDIIARW